MSVEREEERWEREGRVSAPMSALSEQNREKAARLIYFVHGENLDAESALAPENDAHWDHWKDDAEMGGAAYRAVDAIAALLDAARTEGNP